MLSWLSLADLLLSKECSVSSAVAQESCEVKDAPIPLHLSRKHLVSEQKQDPTLSSLFDIAVSEEEIAEMASGYFHKVGVILRKWMTNGVW